MNNALNNNKHLTLEDRMTIQNLLDANVNLTAIGNALGKHRTTISKEIKLHKHMKSGISSSIAKLRCARYQTCSYYPHSCPTAPIMRNLSVSVLTAPLLSTMDVLPKINASIPDDSIPLL